MWRRYAARLTVTALINSLIGPATVVLLVRWWVTPLSSPNDGRQMTSSDLHELRYGQYLGAMFSGSMIFEIAFWCARWAEPLTSDIIHHVLCLAIS